MKKPKAVSKRIRARYLELGLSQRAIAGKGTSYAYISRIEAELKPGQPPRRGARAHVRTRARRPSFA